MPAVLPSVPTGSRAKAQVLTEGHLLWEPWAHCDSPCRPGRTVGAVSMGHREHWSSLPGLSLPRPRLPGVAHPLARASGPQPAPPRPVLPVRALCCPSPRRTPAAGRGGLGHLPVCSGGPAPPGSLSTRLLGEQAPGACWGSGWPLLYGGPGPQAKA